MSFASSAGPAISGGIAPRFSQIFDDPKHLSVHAPRSILIDSRDRDFAKFPNPSEYVIKLGTTFKNVTSARLVSAEIPSTHYAFSSANQNTSMVVTLSPSSSAIVTLPDGNYTEYATLEAALKTSLDAAFVSENVTFAVAVNRSSQKLSITCSDASRTVGVDTTGIANAKKTGWGLAFNLGFAKGATASGVGTLVSPGVVVTNPESYYLISIDPLDRIEEFGIYGSGESGRVFAKVPVATHAHDSCMHTCMYDKQITCNPVLPPLAKLDRIHVKITFHGSPEPIDFNGVDHSLTLELTCSETR
jgi:hypothetical protein